MFLPKVMGSQVMPDKHPLWKFEYFAGESTSKCHVISSGAAHVLLQQLGSAIKCFDAQVTTHAKPLLSSACEFASALMWPSSWSFKST